MAATPPEAGILGSPSLLGGMQSPGLGDPWLGGVPGEDTHKVSPEAVEILGCLTSGAAVNSGSLAGLGVPSPLSPHWLRL